MYNRFIGAISAAGIVDKPRQLKKAKTWPENRLRGNKTAVEPADYEICLNELIFSHLSNVQIKIKKNNLNFFKNCVVFCSLVITQVFFSVSWGIFHKLCIINIM